MDTWVWIVIAVVVVVAIALILWAANRARERRLEERRGEAVELRRQAEAKTQRSEHRASVADELTERLLRLCRRAGHGRAGGRGV